jgi:hypothetical protein
LFKAGLGCFVLGDALFFQHGYAEVPALKNLKRNVQDKKSRQELS